MEEGDINKIENQKIKVSYLNNSIQDFLLPTSLDQFRRKIKKLFQIQNKIDDIFIIYKTQEKNQEEKEIFNEVKRENEYKTFLEKYNSTQILNDMIMIETDRVPDEISRENTKDFEEEIEELIKTHLREAGERIKKTIHYLKHIYSYRWDNLIISNFFRCAEVQNRRCCLWMQNMCASASQRCG